ncbi:hypothetical protein B0H21DRAFT_204183 [Amylocystis lapponica]|nr:hypothetical protein B0H21DRAFT_204183 [Amylocystis lapponica]
MDNHPNPSESPRAGSQAFNLTSATMQNQIHELAKTLPPPRKQNTACDACRSRKVKCNQLPGQSKCQHCLSKNYPCTHYVQQATSEKKRNTSSTKRPRTLSSSSSNSGAPGSSRIGPDQRTSPPTSPPYQAPTFRSIQGGYPGHHNITLQTPTQEVLSYIFSPPNSGSYGVWGEVANRLVEEPFRIEFALDLVEVFFQIVHTRLPLLNPAQFRDHIRHSLAVGAQVRSQSPNDPSSPAPASAGISDQRKPLHPALIATVIAWGAKFSEHPLLEADRKRNNEQSLLAKTLINRARGLAEDMKVHRIPSADHVVIALLIEPMQSQSMGDSNGFHGFWLGSAIRLLLDLQINHKSVMSNIRDPEARGTMIFAWWMACLADAYRSVYYRRKPMLDDDDYDIDFYTVGPVPPDVVETHAPQPSPREQLEMPQFLGYYRAAHALARIARQMSRQLWRPATESDGIPLEVLLSFMTLLSEWREEHLHHVGVPSNLEAEWDFVSAVTACASDATYHIMWVILFNALDDFGIREVNDLLRTGSPGNVLPNAMQIEATKRKVMDEALHGALRIAGLAGVLTSNGYLRLDSAVMHVSCIQAGMLLARLGRPEVMNCVNGLQQYSYAYEECAEQAADIRRVYNQAMAGEIEMLHMASVTPRPGTSNAGDAGQSNSMNVDHPMFGGAYRV